MDTQTVGWWGERLVAAYLQRQGFALLDHHYQKKWGEIDLVFSRRQTIHFVEVKSTIKKEVVLVHKSGEPLVYRPEQLVDAKKIAKIRRTVGSWMLEFGLSSDVSFDVAAVQLVPKTKEAWIEMFWHVE